MRFIFAFGGIFLLIASLWAAPTQAQPLRIDYAAVCASAEAQTEFIASLTDAQRQGYHYQAAAQGLDTEEYIAQSIARECEDYHNDSLYRYGFEFDPLIATRTYGQINCETDWDNECRDELDFTAQAGFLACDLRFRTDLRGRGQAELENRDFLHGDNGQRTNRFRTIRLDLYAEGSRQFWDRWSSSLKLNDVHFIMIVEEATLSQRRDRGCRIPSVAAERREDTPDPSFPSQVSGRIVSGSPHIYEVRVRNESEYPSKMRYDVYVFDSDWGTDGSEFLAGRTTVTVPPNSTTLNQYVRYGATQWRIENISHIPD